jgi:hypothetical protein
MNAIYILFILLSISHYANANDYKNNSTTSEENNSSISTDSKIRSIINNINNRFNNDVELISLTPISDPPTNPLIRCDGWLCKPIPEQHVGVVKYQGAVVNQLLYPGPYWYEPFFTSSIELIKLYDEDEIDNVVCVTSEGIKLTSNFKVRNSIDPINVLETVRRYGTKFDELHIHKRVQAEMLDICSKLTANDIMFKYYDQLNDLLLIALRVENKRFKTNIIVNEVIMTTKPIAPPDIQRNYELLAAAESKTKVLEAEKQQVLTEKQKELIQIQGETAIMSERANAENQRKMLEQRTLIAIELEKVEGKKKQALIEYEIKVTNAGAEAESNKMIAESLKSYWDSPGWVVTEQARLIGPNTQIFGEKIPQFITGAYTSPYPNSNPFAPKLDKK